MPLRPQPIPPALSSTLTAKAPAGEMLVTDIYQGLGDVPRGAIKELRIVQIFPKTTYVVNSPRIGVAGEENTRAILGTVPVEADGSARFIVPAHKPVLFQALDKDGFAYQTMRSTTYVQPGERTSCVGCHEHRMSAPTKTRAVPLAMQRPPSRIEPGELGGRPFAFVEVIQPVLNNHCVKCHSGPEAKKGIVLTGEPQSGFTRSYVSLCGDPTLPTKQGKPPVADPLVPRFAQRNQIQMTPVGGVHGALGSRLMKMLRAGHNDVKLSDADLRRLAAWIDCNAVFYGSFDPADQAKQLAGQPIPMPEIQ
jgi:cytochrome c553